MEESKQEQNKKRNRSLFIYVSLGLLIFFGVQRYNQLLHHSLQINLYQYLWGHLVCTKKFEIQKVINLNNVSHDRQKQWVASCEQKLKKHHLENDLNQKLLLQNNKQNDRR